jgi:aminoglycoside 3-N-acetyltransferase I
MSCFALKDTLMNPSPPFQLRRLCSTDLAAMHGLLDVFASAFEDEAHYSGNRPSAHYLEARLGDPGVFVLVAEAEGQVIGGLVAYELAKFEQARSEVYIYDLAVAQAHRRQGIATALIEALKPLAQARHAWVIYVQADDGDDAAIALYTKLGVREDVMHFDIPVTPSA